MSNQAEGFPSRPQIKEDFLAEVLTTRVETFKLRARSEESFNPRCLQASRRRLGYTLSCYIFQGGK